MSTENPMQAVNNLQEQLIHALESVNASIIDLLFVLKSKEPDLPLREHSSSQLCSRDTELAHISQSDNSVKSKLPVSKVISNKSKFFNDEQRKKVIEYITNPDEQAVIKALPTHKRVSYIQKQLQEKYNINLSFYHTTNIIKSYIIYIRPAFFFL